MLFYAVFGLALAADPQLLQRLYEQAQRAAVAGDLDGAIESLNRITSVKADLPEVENLLGIVYSRRGDFAAVEQHFLKALSIQPKYSEARENLTLFLARQGRSYLQSGDPAQALRALEKIPEAERDDQSWNLIGAAQAKLGRADQAEATFRRALDRNPKQHDVWYNLGLLLAKRGAHDDAIASFQRGLASFPDSVNLATSLGIVYQRKGEVALAQAAFRKLTEAHPENGQPFLFLGSSYLESGDHQQARASLLEAEKRMPPNARVQYLLGLVFSYMGQAKDSAARFRAAIRLDPKLCFAYYQLAKAHVDSEKLPAALEESQAAAACDPDFAQPHYQMSQIHARLGQPREADGEMTRFRELRARVAEKRYQVFELP